jgi:hypothetical protein
VNSTLHYYATANSPVEINNLNTYSCTGSSVPPPNFVISRFADGSVASYYSDLYWDWSPYHPQGRVTRLSFVIWCGPKPTSVQLSLISEIQFLAYVLIWQRDGVPLSYGSMQHYIGALNNLAGFCEKKAISVKQVLNDSRMLVRLYEDLSGVRCKYMAALLFHLTKMGVEKSGLNIARGESWRFLQDKIIKHRAELEQHPPIPTRIFSELLANLKRELDDFESVATAFLELFRLCANDSRLGRTKKRPSTRVSASEENYIESTKTFAGLVEQFGLTAYFLAKGLPFRIHSLPRAMKEIQMVAGLLIKAYSGMRNNESMLLPYDCLETRLQNGKQHYLIKGFTSKLNHGRPKTARWVTSVDTKSAVLLCQRIAKCIYEVCNVSNFDKEDKETQFPLFVAASYAQLGRSPKPITVNEKFVPSTLGLAGYPVLTNRIIPRITGLDLSELESVDPYRKWSNRAEFRIDQVWPLTSHQLRRSLALYASRSGLVSLPTLRRQLQHVTEEMSRYYARGSQEATDLISGNKGHFGQEYQETQFESEALAYIANVLHSEEKLLGGHGTWVDRHLRDGPGNLFIDRKDTLARFRKGELAFRETAFGGCTKTGPCEKRVFEWLSACIACKHSVGKPSRLRSTIKAQEKLLATLPENSIEWRIESDDLLALNRLIERTEGHI